MGRRKIEITAITHERNRSVTFLKRKAGLLKKAYELGVLCSVDIAVVIFDHKIHAAHPTTKLYEYCSSSSSHGVKEIVKRYLKYSGDKDSKGPSDFGGGGKEDVNKDSDDDDDDSESEEEVKPKKRKKHSRSKPRRHRKRSPSSSPSPSPTRSLSPVSTLTPCSSSAETPLIALPKSSISLPLHHPQGGLGYPMSLPFPRAPPRAPPSPPHTDRDGDVDSEISVQTYRQLLLQQQQMQQQHHSSYDDLLAIFGGAGGVASSSYSTPTPGAGPYYHPGYPTNVYSYPPPPLPPPTGLGLGLSLPHPHTHPFALNPSLMSQDDPPRRYSEPEIRWSGSPSASTSPVSVQPTANSWLDYLGTHRHAPDGHGDLDLLGVFSGSGSGGGSPPDT